MERCGDQYFLSTWPGQWPLPRQLEIVFRSQTDAQGVSRSTLTNLTHLISRTSSTAGSTTELAIEEGIALIRVPTFDVSSKEFGALKAIEQELKTAGVQGVVLICGVTAGK